MWGGNIQTAGVIKNAAISFAGAGDNIVVAAVASQIVHVYRLFFIVGGATNITFKDGAGIFLTGAMPFLANGYMVLDPTDCPWLETSAGNVFIINSSNAVQVSGALGYRQS